MRGIHTKSELNNLIKFIHGIHSLDKKLVKGLRLRHLDKPLCHMLLRNVTEVQFILKVRRGCGGWAADAGAVQLARGGLPPARPLRQDGRQPQGAGGGRGGRGPDAVRGATPRHDSRQAAQASRPGQTITTSLVVFFLHMRKNKRDLLVTDSGWRPS